MTGKSRKKKKWTLMFLMLLIIGFVSILGYMKWQQMKKEKADITAEEEIQDYSAIEKVEAAKEKLEKTPKKAKVITDINTVEKEVALCFEGTTDALVIQQILEYLNQYDYKATFFISAVDVSEDKDTADLILKQGHDIESYTLYGTAHMETLEQEELVTDFCRAQAVYQDLLGEEPALLKCNATDYTKEVLEAADASGYASIVYPTHYLNYASFANEKMAKNYVDCLREALLQLS